MRQRKQHTASSKSAGLFREHVQPGFPEMTSKLSAVPRHDEPSVGDLLSPRPECTHDPTRRAKFI